MEIQSRAGQSGEADRDEHHDRNNHEDVLGRFHVSDYFVEVQLKFRVVGGRKATLNLRR
jgi:hypothetical protein